MYNLIFAKDFSSEWATTNLTTAGLVSFSKIGLSGAREAVAANYKGAFDLVLGRANADGGPVILPLHTHALKITHGDYSVPTTFEATLTVSAIDEIGDVTVVIAKKGVPFNERSTWTANFPIKKTMSPTDMADEIVKRINAASSSHGLTAAVTFSSNEYFDITFTAEKAGDDYKIYGADLLSGIEAEVNTDGNGGFGSLEMVKRIASMAAADAGFEYTFKDGADLIYPNYPFDPLKGASSEDKGFSVITISCGEPRATKTTDEVVYQTVFVVFPTDNKLKASALVDVLKTVGTLTSQSK